jgi:hypothetical protein
MFRVADKSASEVIKYILWKIYVIIGLFCLG